MAKQKRGPLIPWTSPPQYRQLTRRRLRRQRDKVTCRILFGTFDNHLVVGVGRGPTMKAAEAVARARANEQAKRDGYGPAVVVRGAECANNAWRETLPHVRRARRG